MTLRDRLAVALVVLLWGLNVVAAKVGVTEFPPLFFLAMRFAAVGLLLAPLMRPRASHLKAIATLSLTLGVGHFGLVYIGFRGLDAATAAIAGQLQVPFSVLVAWAVYGDRPGRWRSVGLVLSFGGVALLAGEPTTPALVPILILALSGLGWAVSNLVIRRLGDASPLVLNGWVSLLATPQLFVLSLLFEDGQGAAISAAGPAGWGALAFTIFGASIAAYTLWYYLLGRYDVSRVVPATLAGPVIGMAGGVLILGDPLTWLKLAGGAVTVAGIALIEIKGRRGGDGGS